MAFPLTYHRITNSDFRLCSTRQSRSQARFCLLSSPEIENILENSDFITLLNQASGDRKILSERLNLSADQQKYIDNSEPGEGLLIFENVVLPFSNPIPKNTQLYKIMTTRLSEVVEL